MQPGDPVPSPPRAVWICPSCLPAGAAVFNVAQVREEVCASCGDALPLGVGCYVSVAVLGPPTDRQAVAAILARARLRFEVTNGPEDWCIEETVSRALFDFDARGALVSMECAE